MEFVVSSDKKLLPYGMMKFADIRLDGYYYVDKTMYIPLIERSNFSGIIGELQTIAYTF